MHRFTGVNLNRAYGVNLNRNEGSILHWAFQLVGEPDSFDHFKLLSAQSLYLAGDKQKCALRILSIQNKDNFNIDQRFWIANTLLEEGYGLEGLEELSESRIEYREDVRAHETFLANAWTKLPHDLEIPIPSKVEMNCYVQLQDESKVIMSYYITDDQRFNGDHIIRSDQKLTTLLLGKSKNEKIEISSKIGNGSILEIVGILSKYHYLIEESNKLIHTRFAADTSFVTFHTGDDADAGALFNFMKQIGAEKQQRIAEVLKLYREKSLTVSSLSIALNRSLLEIWLSVIHGEDLLLKSYFEPETEVLENAITGKQKVVIEPMSLFTIFILLRNPALLNQAELEFIIARSTLAELKKYHTDLKNKELPSFPGFNRLMFSYEPDEQQTQELILILEGMILWCESSATVGAPFSREKDHSHLIGKASQDSLLLAEENNAVLLSDDYVIKKFAQDQHSVKGFSSFELVAKLYRGVEGNNTFSQTIQKLAGSNYTSIPITPEDLWGIYSRAGYNIDQSFRSAAMGLQYTSLKNCAGFIVNFSKELLMHTNSDTSKIAAIGTLLDIAKKNAKFGSIYPLILRLASIEFMYIPIQGEEFLQIISGYFSGGIQRIISS